MSLKPNVLQQEYVPIHEQLPRDLENGLVLRFATLADAEPLAQLSGRVFGKDHFDEPTAAWTRDICSEQHPTCGPTSFTVVEDTRASGKLVSAMCLIPQEWTYGGIPFGVGRMEDVVTDPEYRRRGLLRAQIQVQNTKSMAMGHLIQSISGIPWYYRQFGYEYALEMAGGRTIPLAVVPERKPGEEELYRLRAMSIEEIPFAARLYDREFTRWLVACPRPEWMWRHFMDGTSTLSFENRPFQIIEKAAGTPVGYLAPLRDLDHEQFAINELAVVDAESLRAVMPAVLRSLKVMAEAEGARQNKPVKRLFFMLGREHLLYDAIPELLSPPRPPYAWYVRVPDTASFLRRIGPVLEERLARSAMAGHTGELKINEYLTTLRLAFDKGKLTNVVEERMTGETEWFPAFPPRTLLQLIFGYHSRLEIAAAHSDCWAFGDAAVLLDALFPKRPSHVIPLG